MTVNVDRRTVWQIDPKHTLVEFAVTYLTFTTVKGHFDGVSGTIRADGEDQHQKTKACRQVASHPRSPLHHGRRCHVANVKRSTGGLVACH